jgi:hypothetical protein
MAAIKTERAGETGSTSAEEDVARLVRMLEQEDVEGARSFVKELEQRWPDSPSVRHFARVLAPPVVRVVPGASGRSRDRETAWLREHAREYPGYWLAVLEDRLIAADPSLDVVLAKVRETPGAEFALFHRQYEPRNAADTDV